MGRISVCGTKTKEFQPFWTDRWGVEGVDQSVEARAQDLKAQAEGGSNPRLAAGRQWKESKSSRWRQFRSTEVGGGLGGGGERQSGTVNEWRCDGGRPRCREDPAASFIDMMQLLLPCIHPAASGSYAVFSPLLFCSQQPNTLCTGTRPHSGVTQAGTQKQTYVFILYALVFGGSYLQLQPNQAQSLICLCLPALTGYKSPDLRQPYHDRDLWTALLLHGCLGGCSARSYVPSESSRACASIPIYELRNRHQSEKHIFVLVLWVKLWHRHKGRFFFLSVITCVHELKHTKPVYQLLLTIVW